MQGDWWSHGLSGKPIEHRNSTFSSSSNTWATPAASTSSGTTPKIVTLTVQPLTENAQALAHCSHSHTHACTSATESILAQARRRRRLNMKQKSLHGKRPLSMGAQAEQQDTEACDLRWSSFFERQLTLNSTNSPFGGQDLNSTSSSGPAGKDYRQHAPCTDDYRTMERRLEKERERRTHHDVSPPRLETKVLGDDIPITDQPPPKCNGIRPIKKDNVFNRTMPQPQSLQRSPSYRNSVIRDSLASMGPSTSATLRGHSIGFGNRDAQSLRSPTHKGRMKPASMMVPQGHGSDRLRRSKYQYPDPVPGCVPSFQQRLAELSSLESDTIRYERTKKTKRKAKQEKD